MKNLTVQLVMLVLLQVTIVYTGTRPSFVSDDMIAKAASVVNACQTQTGVATAVLSRLEHAPVTSPNEFCGPDSQPEWCYMYCLWEQFGLVDDKRELSINGMLTFFQRMPAYRAEVQRAINECKRIGKHFANGDNCQYAYTFNKCYAERSPNTYYLF